jgi:hypothetical protein
MIAISFKNKIYHVYDLLNKMTSEQTDFTSVINLCRLRLNKCKKHENDKDTLVIIKVPFIDFWFAF